MTLTVFCKSFSCLMIKDNQFFKKFNFFDFNNELLSIVIILFIQQALQEISVEERKRTLDNSRLELQGIEKRIEQVNKDFKAMEKKVQEAVKRVTFYCYFY